jgi:hypothetical protein
MATEFNFVHRMQVGKKLPSPSKSPYQNLARKVSYAQPIEQESPILKSQPSLSRRSNEIRENRGRTYIIAQET